MIRYVDNSEGMQDLVSWLEGRRFFSFDFETGPAPAYIGTEDEADAGLDPFKSVIVLTLIGDLEDQWVVDNRAVDVSPLKRFVEDPQITKIGANLRFDCKQAIHHLGWYPEGLYDCQIAEQNLRAGIFSNDESKESSGMIRFMTRMAALVKFYFDEEIDKDKEMRISFWKTPIGQFSERQMKYFEGDVKWPIRIATAQKPLIYERGLREMLVEVEFPLITVLADMELEGMAIDQDHWLGLYQDAVSRIQTNEKILDGLFGVRSYVQDDLFGEAKIKKAINYGSSAQKAKALTKLGIPGFVNPDGTYSSTDKSVITLGVLEGRIPKELGSAMLELSKAQQQEKSYGAKFLENVHPITGKIHPDFTQAILVTGRISCSPGLQTIPRDSEYRAAFIAGKGFKYSIVDASQIEARIISDLTCDPVAIQTFLEDGDIYSKDGSLLYGRHVDKKTEEGKKMRGHAKVSWLGLNYGQGKEKFHKFCMVFLGEWLDKETTDFLYDKFFEIHPNFREVMNEWSDSVNPEKSENWFEDDLARKLIYPEKLRETMINSFKRGFNNSFYDSPESRADKLVKNRGRVTYSNTYGGRKRFFRADFLGWWAAGRNAPVQSGAAHIQKKSMVELWRYYRRNGHHNVKLVNAIHDEIIVKAPEAEIKEANFHHERIMTEVGNEYLREVPMKVEGLIADHWLKA